MVVKNVPKFQALTGCGFLYTFLSKSILDEWIPPKFQRNPFIWGFVCFLTSVYVACWDENNSRETDQVFKKMVQGRRLKAICVGWPCNHSTVSCTDLCTWPCHQTLTGDKVKLINGTFSSVSAVPRILSKESRFKIDQKRGNVYWYNMNMKHFYWRFSWVTKVETLSLLYFQIIKSFLQFNTVKCDS